MPFRVIPVLDVSRGVAVHAVGGLRHLYQPLRSVCHPGSSPADLGAALPRRFGLRELYLADLDAINGGPPNESLYEALAAQGLALWVDAGVRHAGSLGPLLRAGVATIVAGLETLAGPGALGSIVEQVGPERLVLSLDLRAGVPIVAPGADWESHDPQALAEQAASLGVRRLVLLDLARVGTGQGPGTTALLSALAAIDPTLEITVGGGVASANDLRGLRNAGASAVLVGSALHDGRIGPDDLADVLA